jgi:hypothetical protein
MTEDKTRKRAVRTRMAKTGERYTAARRHVVKPAEPAPLPSRVADPGMPDESIVRGSGRDWDSWFRILDGWGATERKHGEIAQYLMEEHSVPGWWAQMVTVGYERARGMRARYQRMTGTYSVSVSKTLPVDADRLFRAFTESRARSRWLEPGTLRTRTAQPGRTARFDVGDGSRLIAYFTSKGEARSTVSLEVEKLPDAEAVEEARAFWKERLARLADTLSS